MFKWFFCEDPIQPVKIEKVPPIVESLEERQLLSGHTAHHHVVHAHAHHVHHASHHAHHASKTAASSATATAAIATATTTSGGSTSSNIDDTTFDGQDGGRLLNTSQFSQAPTAVQNGLDALATTDNDLAPTSTQTVYLGNSNGMETYTIEMTSTGTIMRLTVDQNGNPITQPTETTTTWDVLSGTGAGSNAKAAAEITAIATALNLTAPTSTTVVDVSTAADGTATYTVRLSSASSSSTTTTGDGDWYDHGTAISVDSNGNPVGRQELPFSVLPTAIQNGINANLPSGATALVSTSTQTVDVLTANGVTFYSTTFTTAGTSTTVTVDSTGTAASLPSSTTDQFQNIPAAAQTELKTLATADGVAGAISATQSVTIYDESNGTKIYTVTLSATDSSTSQTFNITLSVDQSGNPTVPPNGHDHGGCGDDGGFGGDGGGDWGGGGTGTGDFGLGFRHGSD